MRNPTSEMTTLPLPTILQDKQGSWEFAAGRSWVLERNLLGKAGFERLNTAASQDDIRRILLEHHYPQKSTIKAMLADEYDAVFDFLKEVEPGDGFRTVLLLPRDAHNLKVFLKEELQGDDARSFNVLKPSLLDTSLIDPETLYEAVRGVKKDIKVPDWVPAVIQRAREAYNQHYDAAAIDISVDRDTETIRARLAEMLNAPWFSRALAMRRDLTNYETLLRSRLRGVSKSYFLFSLLPLGAISESVWHRLFDAEKEEIKEAFIGTPYASMNDYVDSYGDEGTATAFLQDGESLLAKEVAEGRREAADVRRVLYYVLTRVIEIRYARMALARVGLIEEDVILSNESDSSANGCEIVGD
ncbi:MAG: V-type ATPase subunit [Clostridiaceae bacterium]|jgi:V/A-type H+-transporting ATPase subunit C|nr:V-type ATPase subunit [Clostridiaceae bacterium]